MMVAGLKFYLHGVNKGPVWGGINTPIEITNYVGCLVGTVVRHDANNHYRGEPAVQRSGNKIMDRDWGKGRGGGGVSSACSE